MAQRHERVAGDKNGIVFHPVFHAEPTAVVALSLNECGGNVGTPIVFLAAGVFDLIDTERIETLGHRVIVIIQSPLTAHLGHAGIGVHRVVFANPLVGFLDARIVLGDAAINQTFDTGVGHTAVTGQTAVGVGFVLRLGLPARRGAVDETAVVDLAGPFSIVVFTRFV